MLFIVLSKYHYKLLTASIRKHSIHDLIKRLTYYAHQQLLISYLLGCDSRLQIYAQIYHKVHSSIWNMGRYKKLVYRLVEYGLNCEIFKNSVQPSAILWYIMIHTYLISCEFEFS